jgi:circadian clock protein KaiB
VNQEIVGEPTGDGGDEMWLLSLYVLGQSAKSVRAQANLERFCKAYLAGRCVIEVVDLANSPSIARTDNIIAIPTLIRQTPKPQRRFIGDLSSTDHLRDDFGISEPDEHDAPHR